MNIQVKQLVDWEQLNVAFNELSKSRYQWIFRGLGSSQWLLQTSLERAIEKFSAKKKPEGLEKDLDRFLDHYKGILAQGLKNNVEVDGGPHMRKATTVNLEDGLLRHFKRRCHHYFNEPPEDDDIMERLTLMRHHGVPSRLLDWTYSFFVAVYFALVEADSENGKIDCAVWAVNSTWLEKETKKFWEGKERIATP